MKKIPIKTLMLHLIYQNINVRISSYELKKKNIKKKLNILIIDIDNIKSNVIYTSYK